jgi:peptidoglycan/LPS O-acetylase OafA/YrhL
VLLEHWRNFLFVDYSRLTSHRILLAPAYLLSSVGHQAVIIFFVMSGYLISGSVFRMAERGTWSWKTYLTHRIVRLWVVLIPGLLLGAFWDKLGMSLHLAPLLYGGASYNHMTPNVSAALTLRNFLINISFEQGPPKTQFGSNGALWSLANEFWYYILFPLGLIVLNRPVLSAPKTWVRIVCGTLFLVIAWHLRGGIIFGFPIWLAGTLLCLVPPPKVGIAVRLTAGILYLPILVLISKNYKLSVYPNDYLLTVFTFLLLWILLSATNISRPSVGERTSRELARFSYTLYVVHMPFLLFVTALTAGNGRWVPDLLHIGEGLGILLLALAYAYGVATVAEFRTDTVRRWIERRLSVGTRPVPARSISSV